MQEQTRTRRKVTYWRKLGNKCYFCGTVGQVQYHHMVPISMGGKDQLENVVPLCEVCHAKIHGFLPLSNHNILVRKGIEKRRLSGKHIGRPSKDQDYRKQFIYTNCASFGIGTMGDAQIMKRIGIGRTRYCQLKRKTAIEHGVENWKQVHIRRSMK